VCQKTKIHGYHIVHIWFSAGFVSDFKGENSPKDASCKNSKYINDAKVPSFINYGSFSSHVQIENTRHLIKKFDGLCLQIRM